VDRHHSTHVLAAQFGMSISPLHTVVWCKVCAQWVSWMLTDSHKKQCVTLLLEHTAMCFHYQLLQAMKQCATTSNLWKNCEHAIETPILSPPLRNLSSNHMRGWSCHFLQHQGPWDHHYCTQYYGTRQAIHTSIMRKQPICSQ
jgi:hypothetical protein